MDERVPALVQPLLQDYLGRVELELPGLLAGFYLLGSIACNAWVEGESDVDALALVTRRCGEPELATLRGIHAAIARTWPRPPVDVSYVHWDDRGVSGSVAPPHPFFHDGVLLADDRADPNSPLRSPIGWWQVQTRGITLLGPAAATLGIRVTPADLVADSRRLLEQHWTLWTRSPRHVLGLRHPDSVDWAVLGILRTWYTLREGDVATKPDAVRYGMRHLPERWHRLLRQTLASRGTNARHDPAFRLRTGLEAALFMRFMVAECRKSVAGSAVTVLP